MAKLHKGNITRAILLKHLVEGICKVAFVKNDGSVRSAYCTLHSELIPIQFEKAIEKIFLPDARQEILPYWDMVQGKWKSFYVERVQLFITADELKQEKDLPSVLKKDEEKTSGNIHQSVNENKTNALEKDSVKSMRQVDVSKNEKTVDPINRRNVQSVNTPKRTYSVTTREKERQKASLEKARNIINKLRKESEERRKK